MGGGYKSPVELNFSYKVAQVNFVITNNSSRTGTLSPYPYITGVPTDGKLRGNTWYDLTTGQANVRYNTSSSPAFPEEGNSKVIGPFYMIPCQLTSSSKFMLSCSDDLVGDTETFEVDLGGVTWEAGKAYTYNITINPQGYVEQYLTFVALQSGTFSFSKAGLSYSLNGGKTWTALAAGASTPTVAAGDSIMWKNNTTLKPSSSDGIGIFSATGNFDAKGNIMSLHYGNNFSKQTDLSGKNYAFTKLFQNCYKIINAENLILPATTLANYCYYYMFRGCTGLTTAPELPATTLTDNCYAIMFSGCTRLVTAPELPATTLAPYCYRHMFYSCTGLTTAPELPATTLADNCYYEMFQYCTGLTTAPELPATTLATGCYWYMFSNCTRLVTAPELPATTLATSCYRQMFQKCTNLTTAPELPATTLAPYCYEYMFEGCTKLCQVKAAFTTTPSATFTDQWLRGVSSTGTFYKNSAATWTTTGGSAVPSGWTVVTYTP